MDAVIVQSEELKGELPIIRSLARSTVIPVGYNGRLFGPLDRQRIHDRRKAFGCSDDRIVLVYVGSMARFRHLDRLIEGFAKAKRLSENLQLLMVGDGVAVKDLEAQAKALGIVSDVVFTGRVSHENMMDYLAVADIGISFVPISRSYNYNPPLKTFEFLACGMPVIATRTVSNSRIVTEGFNGVLVEDTAESLCEGIIRLTSDRSLQDHIKMNASKSVADFDFERITKNMLVPLYMKLLNK
jgi:glycosyltransferase involved in cell wall biosynthesis